MSVINLFYSQEESRYYWTGSDVCVKCKKIISVQGILVWDYWNTELRQHIFCGNCKQEALRIAGPYAEIKPVVIGFEFSLPEDVEGIIPSKPSLINATGLSVIDAAIKINEGKTIDKTHFAKPTMIGNNKVLEIEKKEVSE